MVTVVNHPLVLYRLSLMREKRTPVSQFRRLAREIGQLMAYEVLRDLPTTEITVETPLATMQAPTLAASPLVLVSVLRAGDGLLSGFLESVPTAAVGHIGLSRDHVTLMPTEYLCSLPSQVKGGHAVVLDPMLATGNSAVHAVDTLKEKGAATVKLVCLLAAPEGLNMMALKHPDVEVFVAAIDERLDERGYILPGLGDAGDRIFGTL